MPIMRPRALTFCNAGRAAPCQDGAESIPREEARHDSEFEDVPRVDILDKPAGGA